MIGGDYLLMGTTLVVFAINIALLRGWIPLGRAKLDAAPPFKYPFEISKAQWGNVHTKKNVVDIISAMPPNALTFHVVPDTFRKYDESRADPAPGDPEKYLEVTYQFDGVRPYDVRRKQGEWIVLPMDVPFIDSTIGEYVKDKDAFNYITECQVSQLDCCPSKADVESERGTYFLASSIEQCYEAFKVLCIFRSIEEVQKRRCELKLEGKAKIFRQVFFEVPEISQGLRLRELATETSTDHKGKD